MRCSHGRKYPEGLEGANISCWRCRNEWFGAAKITVSRNKYLGSSIFAEKMLESFTISTSRAVELSTLAKENGKACKSFTKDDILPYRCCVCGFYDAGH